MSDDANMPGGPPRLEVLFRDHVRYVLRSLQFLGVPERDVQDAGQEVFLIIHRRLPQYEGEKGLKTWIYRICWRVAADWRRGAYQRRVVIDSDVSQLQSRLLTKETPELEAARRMRRDKLLAALQQLESHQRDVFVLYEIEALPMKDVAAITGAPLQTAYDRLHAARRKLQRAWAEISQELPEASDG